VHSLFIMIHINKYLTTFDKYFYYLTASPQEASNTRPSTPIRSRRGR
jgi:hypothetical protein